MLPNRQTDSKKQLQLNIGNKNDFKKVFKNDQNLHETRNINIDIVHFVHNFFITFLTSTSNR